MNVLGKLWHLENIQKQYDANTQPGDEANLQINYPFEFMTKPAHSDYSYITQYYAILT